MEKSFELITVVESEPTKWSDLLDELLYGSPSHYKLIFSHLINGISETDFFNSIFEKKAVHFSRSLSDANANQTKKRKLDNTSGNTNNGDIFSREIFLNTVVSHNLVPLNNVTVTKYDGVKRIDHEFKKKSDAHPMKMEELKKVFFQGYTVQFYQPQRFNDPLYKMNCGFEHKFGTLAGSSAYLTPPGKLQGLEPHHDDVEVFILQTEGCKIWRLYLDSSANLPDFYAKNLPKDRLKRYVELKLSKGDLLYLPRGVIHEAVTSEEAFSTHVTISVYQRYNYKTLLNALVPKLSDSLFSVNEDFRRGLPVRMQESFGTGAPNKKSDPRVALLAKVKEFAMMLADRATELMLDETVDELMADFVENRLPPPDLPPGSSGLGSGESTFKLIDSASMHMQIETEEDGTEVLAMYSAAGNDRRRHMGHPCPDEEEEDDEDEDEDAHVLRLPIRCAPLLSTLRLQGASGMTEKQLTVAVAPFIKGSAVREYLKEIAEKGFLEEVV